MKKRLLLISLLLPLLLGGCGLGSVNVETTADPADYSYVYMPETERQRCPPKRSPPPRSRSR